MLTFYPVLVFSCVFDVTMQRFIYITNVKFQYPEPQTIFCSVIVRPTSKSWKIFHRIHKLTHINVSYFYILFWPRIFILYTM